MPEPLLERRVAETRGRVLESSDVIATVRDRTFSGCRYHLELIWYELANGFDNIRKRSAVAGCDIDYPCGLRVTEPCNKPRGVIDVKMITLFLSMTE